MPPVIMARTGYRLSVRLSASLKITLKVNSYLTLHVLIATFSMHLLLSVHNLDNPLQIVKLLSICTEHQCNGPHGECRSCNFPVVGGSERPYSSCLMLQELMAVVLHPQQALLRVISYFGNTLVPDCVLTLAQVWNSNSVSGYIAASDPP